MEFVNAGESPYYWANFQMTGEAIEPLYADRKLAGMTDSNVRHNRKEHDKN